MTRVQTLDDARQLQRDMCMMISNLSVLAQYALCLHGTASELLELVVGRHDFPSAVMVTAAPVPRVDRASIHMEAMGLWRMAPVGLVGTLSTWALQMPVILRVHRECPVGSRCLSSRTRELFLCLWSYTL